ncbi:MAG: TonB-dependent receptor, partial [Pedobacter sp.]
SYGKVGNIAGIGNAAAYSLYGSGLYGGLATLQFNSVGNPDITWETSAKTDIGATMGFFKDRLTLELAYYMNDIDNLLLSVPQSPSAGLPNNVFQNVGTMYNKGIEVGISATPVSKSNFSWTTNFNFTYNKNEVTSLANGITELLHVTSSLETVNKSTIGNSLGTLWVVRTGGVDPNTGRRIFYNKAGEKIFYQFGTLPAGQFNWMKEDGTQYTKNGVAAQITWADDAVSYA